MDKDRPAKAARAHAKPDTDEADKPKADSTPEVKPAPPAERPPAAAAAATKPTTRPTPWRPPPPPPPPPPLIPDTQPQVEKPPEPEKQDFKYRAAPARPQDPTPPSTATILAATGAAAPEQPAARRPGFLTQVKQAIGIDEDKAAAAAATAATAATVQPATAAESGTSAASASPTQSAPVKPDEPAAMQPQAAQPQARQPQAQQPDARKPAVEQKRRVVAAPAAKAGEPEYKPGDLICGNCGAGNDPARRFCRRCGTNLVDAVVVAPPPWYRRIFRRRDRALKAGERPKWMGDQERRGGSVNWLNRAFKLRRLVMGLLLLGVGLGIASYAFLPDVKGQVDNGINQVRRMIMPSYGPITPHDFAGPALTDHEPELAFDGGSNTYWAANSGPTLALTVTFDRQFDLGAVLMSTAPVATRTEFDRPKTVELSFPNSDAKPIVLNLQDSDKQIQNSGLEAKGVTVVVLTFKDYYPAVAGSDSVLAMTDIQFQERN